MESAISATSSPLANTPTKEPNEPNQILISKIYQKVERRPDRRVARFSPSNNPSNEKLSDKTFANLTDSNLDLMVPKFNPAEFLLQQRPQPESDLQKAR